MTIGLFLGTLFFSLGLDKIFLYLLNKFSSVNIFSKSSWEAIPSFSRQLAQAKSIDIIEYGLLVLVIAILFAFTLIFIKHRQRKARLYDWLYFGVSLLFFAQVNFVDFSGTLVLAFFVLFQFMFWTMLMSKGEDKEIVFNPKLFTNGIFLGLVMMQVIQKFNYSLILPLFVLGFMPLLYHLLPFRFLQNPSHLLLIFLVIKPGNFYWLLFLLIITAIFVVITEIMKSKNKEKIFNFIFKIYPFALITIVAFNPLYYRSDLDSVEEGFWLGWLQRLLNNQIIYRDFMAHQPPLLAWTLKYFVLLTGATVANVKLFFHLLQIVAYFIFYSLIKTIINNKVARITILTMIMGISNGLTKNNVEIRLAMGLLPLIPLFNYINSKKNWWLIWAGIANALSIFISLEVGIVSFLSVSIYLITTQKTKIIKPFFYYLCGLLTIVTPISFFLFYHGAFLDMVGQLAYYSNAFSNGFFNLAVERSNLLQLLDWRIVNNYLGSIEMWWQFSQLTIIGSLFWGISKSIKEKKENPNTGIVITLCLIGLFLFRSALGRSDWWHLLFPLIIALILFGFLVENLCKKISMIFGISLIVFTLILNRSSFNDFFIYSQVEKIQSYGKIPGTFKNYKNSKFGIAVDQGTDTAAIDDLIDFLSQTPSNQKIFAYPWMPEIYFLSGKENATKNDTPYGFFTLAHQIQMITDLDNNQKAIIIYNPNMNFADLSPLKLELINNYILNNYRTTKIYGKFEVKERI
ncbi:MAG: glycosyltransferase family 39 protein [Candidatus Shapirobacteria bacterium]|jgi:hypothetical protein